MKVSTKTNWDEFWRKKQNVSDVYANSDRIRRYLNRAIDLKGKRVLEIGAGTGRDSFYMTDDGCQIYLLDYSMNSLKIINELRNGIDAAHCIGADAFRLPFPDASFDVVFHQGLLEHFRKPQAFKLLLENSRILKTGGLLLVDVPQRYHVYTIIKHVLISINAWFAGWEREFSLRELERIYGELGIRVVSSYGEWMYPSLLYRMIREGLLKIGVKIPLVPPKVPVLSRLRRALRGLLQDTSIQKNTALSIGVIGRK